MTRCRGEACLAPTRRTPTHTAVREPPPRYEATPQELPRESVLHGIWETQRYPRGSLILRDGSPVRVIYRGRPGLGPGPDFRDAIAVLPSGLAQGDVELHVRASDFYRHGHHLDPAYNGVILHTVFRDDTGEDTVLEDGRRIPIATVPLPGSGRLPAPFGEPCRGAVPRVGADAVGQTLERLGGMRFRQKSAAFARHLRAGEPAEELLWRGLLDALGYGGTALSGLAGDLPWGALRRELLAQPPERRAGEAARLLASAFATIAPAPTRGGIRPGNRPERRLAGAAVLATRFAGEGLAASLLVPLAEDDAVAHILDALAVPKLIGRPRAIEIAANAVLPLAAALTGDPAARRYEALYSELPLPARYGAVRHLHQAVRAAVEPSARRQQGMLYLLRQYCSQGGCGRCPLS